MTALPLTGDRGRPAVRGSAPGGYHEAADLRELRREANAEFQAGGYYGALRKYESGYEQATGRRDLRSALRFLNNLGSADYQLHRYREPG